MTLKGKEFVEHISGLFVSSDGEVWFEGSGRGAYPNGHFTYGADSHGYKVVKYKCKQYKVHRLVAEIFLDNPDKLPTVDHINRVRDDNRVENLRWANMSLQSTNQNHPQNNAKSKKVLQYSLEGEFVKEWSSINECGRNGFHFGAVSECCRGKRNTYKGFKWKYKHLHT